MGNKISSGSMALRRHSFSSRVSSLWARSHLIPSHTAPEVHENGGKLSLPKTPFQRPQPLEVGLQKSGKSRMQQRLHGIQSHPHFNGCPNDADMYALQLPSLATKPPWLAAPRAPSLTWQRITWIRVEWQMRRVSVTNLHWTSVGLRLKHNWNQLDAPWVLANLQLCCL